MTGEGLEGDRGVLASFLDGKSKPAQALAVLLHGMYEEEYDDVAQLAVSNEPHQLLLDASTQKASPGSLSKALNDWTKALAVQDYIVGASMEAPGPSLRFLARRVSSEENDGTDKGSSDKAAMDERRDVWNRANVQRKKLCQFLIFKDEKLAKEAVKKSSAMSKLYKPEPGQSHCLYVFSSDLAYETEAQPWAQTSAIPASDKRCTSRLCLSIRFESQNNSTNVCCHFDWGP